MLEFNLLSAVRACRAALPLLLERGGAIVNVVSAVARQPAAMNVDYCAAKAALLNLTKALSEEFGAARRAREQRLARPDAHAVVDRRGRRGGHRRGLDRQRRRAGGRDGRAGADAAHDRPLRRAAGDRRRGRATSRRRASGSTTGAELVVDGGMLKAL